MVKRQRIMFLGLSVIGATTLDAGSQSVGFNDDGFQSFGLTQISPDSDTSNSRNPHVLKIGPLLASDVPAVAVAAYKGDLRSVRSFISRGVNIESAGSDNRTSLLLATAGGRSALVRVLLKAGAKVDARDSSGSTALHWAALTGNETIVFLLLKYRATVNIQDTFGETPLIFAAISGNENMIKALLAAGANSHLRDASGLTAKAWAKRNRYEGIVSLLDQNTLDPKRHEKRVRIHD